MGHHQKSALLTLVVSAPMLLASLACAQTTPAPPQASPNNGATKDADKPLSKKLNENDGVLKPPHGVDPEMHQAPPARTGDKMPVIIPPGEPGGDQSVQPK
jgi:hypothetical protein